MAAQQQRRDDPRDQDNQHPYEEEMENTQGNDFAGATGPQDESIERTVDEDDEMGRIDEEEELPDAIGIPVPDEGTESQGSIEQGNGNLPTGTNDDPTHSREREDNMDMGEQ